MPFEENIDIGYPPKIDIGIRFLNVSSVVSHMRIDVSIYQRFEIYAGILESPPDHIGADSFAFRRVASLVIGTLVYGLFYGLLSCSVDDILYVTLTILIDIGGSFYLWNEYFCQYYRIFFIDWILH